MDYQGILLNKRLQRHNATLSEEKWVFFKAVVLNKFFSHCAIHLPSVIYHLALAYYMSYFTFRCLNLIRFKVQSLILTLISNQTKLIMSKLNHYSTFLSFGSIIDRGCLDLETRLKCLLMMCPFLSGSRRKPFPLRAMITACILKN